MAFTFEALPARYGDCLLLTFEQPDRTRRMLVDGGPRGVYRAVLAPRLDRERREAGQDPLTLDAVMVSHIDDDHIHGILELFNAVRDAEERRAPPPFRIRTLLHNSFDALAGDSEGAVGRQVERDMVLSSSGGEPDLNALLPPDQPRSHQAELVLASYAQGTRLSSLASALRIARNPPDQKVLWCDPRSPRRLHIGEATFTILGPLAAEVEVLRREWASWRRKTDGAAALAAYLDRSEANLSSIVALLEVGGFRGLFTGDALGRHILTALDASGYLSNGPLKLDLLKLPHHGSARNVALDFFQRIHADHYVVSGDGTHGNPDRETLEMLAAARPQGGYTVHLTYDAASCDVTHKAWRSAHRRPPIAEGRDTIADLVAAWRQQGHIEVREGPVTLRFD